MELAFVSHNFFLLYYMHLFNVFLVAYNYYLNFVIVTIIFKKGSNLIFFSIQPVSEYYLAGRGVGYMNISYISQIYNYICT